MTVTLINTNINRTLHKISFLLSEETTPDGFEVQSVEEFTGNPDAESVPVTPEEAGVLSEGLLRYVLTEATAKRRPLPVVPSQWLSPGSDVLGRDVSDEEMTDRMGKIRDKEEVTRDVAYVHRSTLFDKSGKPLDVDQFKQLISQRPTSMIKQNSKLAKSSGGKRVFYNLSLPAMMGLVVDEKTNTLKVINTCPGAGACKVYCYATKGGYIQYAGPFLSQTRVLNFLYNDRDGFKQALISELAAIAPKPGSKDEVFVRWHDAGDFFSENYLNLAYEVARQLPTIKFYAYTKRPSMVKNSHKPENFLFNYSKGATHSEEQQMDVSADQMSVVVPLPLFTDLVHKEFVPELDKAGNPKKDKKGQPVGDKKTKINSDADLTTLKDRLAKKYGVPVESILSYAEMMDTPPGDHHQYNVIVMPGDGDVSAARDDVKTTFLLMH